MAEKQKRKSRKGVPIKPHKGGRSEPITTRLWRLAHEKLESVLAEAQKADPSLKLADVLSAIIIDADTEALQEFFRFNRQMEEMSNIEEFEE